MAKMATKQATTDKPEKSDEQQGSPRSLDIAKRGIKTDSDFANMMSALMSDLIEGKVTPSVGNATCNAGGKLLKVVELKYKYGTQGKGQEEKTLLLATGPIEDAICSKTNG
jgi:hypothetical protein